MPWILMILISAGWNIAACCGAEMLATMWVQADLLVNMYCGEGCDMLAASLDAELSTCLDCHLD